jgi:NAD(P)-dependent dehydrogenase (short-subunit alcohol dehydrogenase family)
MSIMDKFSLEGYCSIVTGASMGLGKAISIALAEAGSNVVVADINTEKAELTRNEIINRGRDAIVVKCDVTSEADCQNVVDAAMKKYGKINVLVNNAGISIHEKAENMKYSDWLKVININLNGVFLMAQAVGRIMIKQKKGSIINISSMSGLIANVPQAQSAYNASKGGVIMLTKSLASEWVEHNIRVNTIAPTYLETEMISELVRIGKDKAMVDKWVEMTPMKRMGKPEEIGGIAVYLASEASTLATGSVFVIDGGYTVW